jgi:hypothetical protein
VHARSSRLSNLQELDDPAARRTGWRRYVLWCAKARRFDRLRNSLDLLMEVAATT